MALACRFAAAILEHAPCLVVQSLAWDGQETTAGRGG